MATDFNRKSVDDRVKQSYRDVDNHETNVAVITDPGDQLGTSDIVDVDYISLLIQAGVTEVEAKAGASPLADRKTLTIYNDSNVTIFYGPTGVTTTGATKGEPLAKTQSVSIPAGPNNSVFIITTAAAKDVIIQEWS